MALYGGYGGLYLWFGEIHIEMFSGYGQNICYLLSNSSEEEKWELKKKKKGKEKKGMEYILTGNWWSRDLVSKFATFL